MTKGNFLFYESFAEMFELMPTDADKVEFIRALYQYGIYKQEVETSPLVAVALAGAKPNIDAANRRYEANVENGKKGGRPKNSETQQNPTKPTETQQNPNEPNFNETNPSEPTSNHNDNVNGNVDGNVDADVEDNADVDAKYIDETSSSSNPPSAEENFSEEETTLTNCPDPSDKAEKYSAEINEIVAYLNEKTQSSYRTSTANTRRHIVARLKQCYTVADFKHVIDVKCAEWLNNPEMAHYLRPETLFTERNFENYLQQKMPEAKTAARAGQPNTHYKQANLADIDYSVAY